MSHAHFFHFIHVSKLLVVVALVSASLLNAPACAQSASRYASPAKALIG